MLAFLLVGWALLLGYSVVAIDHPEDFVNLLAGKFFLMQVTLWSQ
jgi:hypothetical protein